MTDTQVQNLSPDEQKKLDSRLIWAAYDGHAQIAHMLLAAGANVHAGSDEALRWAAANGRAETAKVLLANGADVHAINDLALRLASREGHMDTVKVLARHIFAPGSWRGKSRAEIEAQARVLFDKIEAWGTFTSEHLHKAAMILADCAIDCWHEIRPGPPPDFKISPLPAQPKLV
jgi:ankyrin repeat protein